MQSTPRVSDITVLSENTHTHEVFFDVIPVTANVAINFLNTTCGPLKDPLMLDVWFVLAEGIARNPKKEPKRTILLIYKCHKQCIEALVTKLTVCVSN